MFFIKMSSSKRNNRGIVWVKFLGKRTSTRKSIFVKITKIAMLSCKKANCCTTAEFMRNFVHFRITSRNFHHFWLKWCKIPHAIRMQLKWSKIFLLSTIIYFPHFTDNISRRKSRNMWHVYKSAAIVSPDLGFILSRHIDVLVYELR